MTSNTTAASVSSLKCSMLAILDSISAYTKVHSEWSNRAPGLSRDPILQINHPSNSTLPSIQDLNRLALKASDQSISRPPIFGSSWEEHVQFCNIHSDPLPGLGSLRSSVMAELAYLEKVSRSGISWMKKIQRSKEKEKRVAAHGRHHLQSPHGFHCHSLISIAFSWMRKSTPGVF